MAGRAEDAKPSQEEGEKEGKTRDVLRACWRNGERFVEVLAVWLEHENTNNQTHRDKKTKQNQDQGDERESR